MATKRKSPAGKSSAAGSAERRLAATVRRSAREIWYAGLGVFSTTRDEGEKVYQALVAEGRRVEAQARKLADAQVAQVRAQLTRATMDAQKRALSTWAGVERNLKKKVGAVKAKVSKLRGAKKRPAARRTARRAKK